VFDNLAVDANYNWLGQNLQVPMETCGGEEQGKCIPLYTFHACQYVHGGHHIIPRRYYPVPSNEGRTALPIQNFVCPFLSRHFSPHHKYYSTPSEFMNRYLAIHLRRNSCCVSIRRTDLSIHRYGKDLIYSTKRSDKATSVRVGLAAGELGNTERSQTNRFS
jgi:hypothetical protein